MNHMLPTRCDKHKFKFNRGTATTPTKCRLHLLKLLDSKNTKKGK